MKKVYNKYSTSDIPLDASLSGDPSTSISKAKPITETKKPTIKAIGTKAKTSAKKATTKNGGKGQVRKKLAKDSIDLKELEKLNEDNIQSHSFRSKRNQVIIVILSLLLAVAVTFIAIYIVVTRVENNCFLYTHGSVNASYLVDNSEISEFRSPANIQGECIFEIDVDLKIKESGEFKVKFTVLCYYNDTLLQNVEVYEPDTSKNGLFTRKSDGYYHSKSTISGNSTINLCRGIAMNEFDFNIKDDNFRLEFHTYLEKV